jgi:hypothetical protein
MTRSEFDRRVNQLAQQTARSESHQVYRHYQALERMQAEQQMRENLSDRRENLGW